MGWLNYYQIEPVLPRAAGVINLFVTKAAAPVTASFPAVSLRFASDFLKGRL
jgi:hypothetical protein